MRVWELRWYKGEEPVLVGEVLPLKCRVTVFLQRLDYIPVPVPWRMLWRHPKNEVA